MTLYDQSPVAHAKHEIIDRYHAVPLMTIHPEKDSA